MLLFILLEVDGDTDSLLFGFNTLSFNDSLFAEIVHRRIRNVADVSSEWPVKHESDQDGDDVIFVSDVLVDVKGTRAGG